MALSDIAGIFSRKFIVGFFVPVFFSSYALTLLVDQAALPSALRHHGGGRQLLVLAGFSLVAGLLLWGVHYSLIRFFEGYWLIAPARSNRRGLRSLNCARLAIGRRMRDRWRYRRAVLASITAEPDRSDARTRAARELTVRYPPENRLLPTELGNAIRAFETHPRKRYQLDGIVIWPRIATMLTESERAELEDKTTDFGFWVNSLFVVLIAGILLFADRLWHPPGGAVVTIAIEVAVVAGVAGLATWSYRQAIATGIRWGDVVRAAFDVHRIELYVALGVTPPVEQADEHTSGDAINRLLAFGEPVPDELRATPEEAEGPPDQISTRL